MLQKMRDHSQSTATKILLGLLIIVFTMFGFGAFEAFIEDRSACSESERRQDQPRRSSRWRWSGRSSGSWLRWGRTQIRI